MRFCCDSKIWAFSGLVPIPIGSMVLLYMVTWIPSIYPLYVMVTYGNIDIYIYISHVYPPNISPQYTSIYHHIPVPWIQKMGSGPLIWSPVLRKFMMDSSQSPGAGSSPMPTTDPSVAICVVATKKKPWQQPGDTTETL